MASNHVAADSRALGALAARLDGVGGRLGLVLVCAEHLQGPRQRREHEFAVAEFPEGVLAALALHPQADPARVQHLFVVLRGSRALQSLRDVVLEAGVADLQVDRFVVR